MEVLLDLLGHAAVTGMAGMARGARRPARPRRPVKWTPWLTVAAVVVALEAAAVGVIVALVMRVAIRMMDSNDMLAPISGMIAVCVGFFVLCVGLGSIGWLVAVVRDVLTSDSSARIGVAGAGVGGLLMAMLLSSVSLNGLSLMFLLPSAAALAISVAPPVWRPVEVVPILFFDEPPEPPDRPDHVPV